MTKQIGVISDIHSNYTAFKAAAKYMINRGITEFFLLGQRKVIRGESDEPLWIYNSACGNLLYTYELPSVSTQPNAVD